MFIVRLNLGTIGCGTSEPVAIVSARVMAMMLLVQDRGTATFFPQARPSRQ